MANISNVSAVLDVVTENKEISSLLRDHDSSSIYSNSTLENSLIQSPSLESFSTIHDTELLELNMEENSDLCVKIDNPQKHLDTLETYITFRITTKVARIEFDENEYRVRRRYNDFIWLRQKLLESHPFCIIPPLPGKHTLIGQLDRYSKEFIFIRMKSLNVFISRIVQHPILSCNEHFKLFITATQTDFVVQRKQRITSNKLNSIQQSLTTQTNIQNRHIEFEKAKEYLTILAEKLTCVEKISHRINREHHDLVTELNHFYPIFFAWSATEPELAAILQNIANAIDKSATAQSIMISNYPSMIGNPVKEFLMYIDVVKDTLQKREAFQRTYENSLDELTKRRTEKDQLMAVQNSSHPSGGFALWKQPSCDEKLEKLGTHIPQLVKKVETNQDNLECANESLRSDIERWHLEKQECIKKILLDFVNKQIDYYQKSVGAWEYVTNELASQNVSMHNNVKK